MLETYKSLKAYPDKLRRVKYYDEELDREFVFITNNMELSAEEIALLYKNRWQVELFFKCTTVQRNYPIGSVDLNRNHSSDVLV